MSDWQNEFVASTLASTDAALQTGYDRLLAAVLATNPTPAS